MSVEALECEAGKTAFFGGQWTEPCFEPASHRIGTSGTLRVVLLCQAHFEEVDAVLEMGAPISEQELRRRQLEGPS